MGEAGAGPLAGNERALVNWQELRRTATALFAVALAIITTVWCLLALPRPRLDVLMAVAVLLLGAGLASRLRFACPNLASLVLVGATMTGLAMLAAFAGLPVAIYFLVIPVVMAGTLFHPAGALACAALASALAFTIDATGDAWLPQVILLGAMGVCVFLALYYSRASLWWAWRRNEQVNHLAEQLRDRQGLLNRTMRTLELTNHLLQRTNRELELARREAEEARHLKAEFAANISHELRTPLNIILGFTEVMSRSPEVYGDVNWTMTLRRDIGEIRRNARYLSEYVDDILDLARVDALRMPIHREPADLGAVIWEAAEVIRRLLQDKPVRLHVDLPRELPQLLIDKTRVRQVLLNLLTNACRFTEEGSISVRAVANTDEVIITVADTGCGIPQDQLEQIFDAFQQVSAWRRPGDRGKGLGLAVAKQLVQLHGGRIWAESTAGKGSAFHFSLPLVAKEVARLGPTSALPLATSASPPSVVVIDDGELAATYLQRHLDGYAVMPARNTEEAHELVQNCHPKAVVVNLPPGAGISTNDLKDLPLPQGVPVIGCSLPCRRWLAQDERFAASLTKPVSAEELLATVARLAPEGEVLVVDDERGFVHFVQRSFQAAGQDARLRWAYDGAEALEKMRERKPALVLLDVVLPGIDGFALADAMHQEPTLADIPIVVVTGANLGEDALAIRGDTFVFSKRTRFRGDELLSLIRSVLALAKPDYVTYPDNCAAQPTVETGTPAF
ncbi:MAG: ATP-binding protein [Anaerolineae bacterium]